jgi:hypothetical protein
MTTRDFDTLYNQLADAWETHERLRRSHASLTMLADSSARLYQARMAMWDWHRTDSSRND